jgi:hypothetical protein
LGSSSLPHPGAANRDEPKSSRDKGLLRHSVVTVNIAENPNFEASPREMAAKTDGDIVDVQTGEAKARPAILLPPGWDETGSAENSMTVGSLRYPGSLEELVAENLLDRVLVQVSNGNGVRYMATRVGHFLESKGYSVGRIDNANHFNHPRTIIYYRDGFLHDAYQIAKEIPGYQEMSLSDQFNSPDIQVRLMIGKDVIRHDNRFNLPE